MVAQVTFIRQDQILLVAYHLQILTNLLGDNMEYEDMDLAEQLAFVDLLHGLEVWHHHHQHLKFGYNRMSLVIAECHQPVHQFHVKKSLHVFL